MLYCPVCQVSRCRISAIWTSQIGLLIVKYIRSTILRMDRQLKNFILFLSQTNLLGQVRKLTCDKGKKFSFKFWEKRKFILTGGFQRVAQNVHYTLHQIKNIVSSCIEKDNVFLLRGHSHIEFSHSFRQVDVSGWVGLALWR